MAAATEGAKEMRLRPPTSCTSAHPNLAAAACSAAQTASRIAKGKAQPMPTHRQATVRILMSPPPIAFLHIEIEYDGEHEGGEAQVPMRAGPATGQQCMKDK
jgi:hypothetical protein